MIPKRTLTATLEISTGSLILTSRPPAFQGEVHALALSISLLDGGAAYTPTGNVVAQMYLYWPGTVEMTETVPLTISGSTLTGTLPETLTAVPGCPLLVIQITDEDSGDLIVAAASPIQITNVLGGTVISTRPPTPSEIIYVGRSPYIDGVTGNWVQWDTDAGEYVDTGVHAKGDKGDQGIPGPVATVNGVQPDAQGNVQLGDFGGATSSVAGSSGMVPAPAAGDDDMFLRGDGTWAEAGSVKSVNTQTPDNTGDITLSGANIPSSAITGAANVDAGLSALSGQIGDLAGEMAYIESGDNASRGYTKGQFILWKGDLYRVKADTITSGNAFTVGTNIEDVGDQGGLNALNSNLSPYTNTITPIEIIVVSPSSSLSLSERVKNVITQIYTQMGGMPSGINQFYIKRGTNEQYASFIFMNGGNSGTYGMGLYIGYYTDYVYKCVLVNGVWTVKQLAEV